MPNDTAQHSSHLRRGVTRHVVDRSEVYVFTGTKSLGIILELAPKFSQSSLKIMGKPCGGGPTLRPKITSFPSIIMPTHPCLSHLIIEIVQHVRATPAVPFPNPCGHLAQCLYLLFHKVTAPAHHRQFHHGTLLRVTCLPPTTAAHAVQPSTCRRTAADAWNPCCHVNWLHVFMSQVPPEQDAKQAVAERAAARAAQAAARQAAGAALLRRARNPHDVARRIQATRLREARKRDRKLAESNTPEGIAALAREAERDIQSRAKRNAARRAAAARRRAQREGDTPEAVDARKRHADAMRKVREKRQRNPDAARELQSRGTPAQGIDAQTRREARQL